jgi:ribosomal protein S18 acetylase RimI-like enzyme
LLQACRDKERLGAIGAQLQAGRSAFLTLPNLTADAPPQTAAALLAGILKVLERRGMRLVQTLLTADYGDDFDLLRAAGFEHFADLLYMASESRAFPDRQPLGELIFEPFSESHLERMGKIIERTYVGSQDCPRLTGVRQMVDVIAGYRGTGNYDPARWFFLRHAGADVGCLLLAEHTPQRQWEVAYVGLVPEARGRGWGVTTIRQAQWLTRQAGMSRLLLAVDAANAPAIATYAAAGFAAWDRRTVMLRILD